MDASTLLNDDQFKIKEENRTFADFANGGLTVVPVTVFKRKYITKLDISCNNIRSLPTDIGNLINLKYLNLSSNGFRCTNPDDTSTIPREITKIRGLEYLDISECNLSFIPSSIWEIISLTSLNISGNKINILPGNVGNLDKLKWLNAQHTGLKTVPEEMVGCESLETLLLYGNQIATLPYVLADMKNLKTMSINLQHMAEMVDSNMESLLQNGQIKSDHISNTIFNLPRIEKIELEYCKINFVPHFHSQYLTELLLRGNLFRTIPECLYGLESLQILDLGENLLKIIPKEVKKLTNLVGLRLGKNNLENVCSEIFEMKCLEELDISHNSLQKISVPKTLNNVTLKTLDLSFNGIEVLPDSITNLKMLENLQIVNNKIKELPVELCSMKTITKMHQYKGLYKVGMWLLNNPILFPPPQIWNTTDIGQLYSYLEKIKIQRLNKRDPIRIVLIGDDNTQKLKFLSQFLNKPLPEDFQFITIDYWTSPNTIPFVLINIDSNPIYSSLWRHFIHTNSLIWLFIDKDNGTFLETFNRWLGMISDCAEDCIVQLIIPKEEPTQTDEKETCETLDSSVEIDSKEAFYNVCFEKMNDKYKTCKITILPKTFSFPISEGLSELEQYKNQLEYQAIDKAIFREDSNFEMFKDKAVGIERFLKSKKNLYINLERISGEIKDIFGIVDNILYACLAILHKQGKIFWSRNNGDKSSKIYPSITLFLKSITAILKSDYKDLLDSEKNPLLRAEGLLTPEKVDEIRANFYDYGEIPLPIYKILTFSLSKSLFIKDFLVDVNVAWTVPILSVPGRDSYIRPYLVLPCFNRVPVDNMYFLKEVLTQKMFIKVDFAISVKHFSSSDCSDIFTSLSSAVNCFAEQRFDWMNLCYVIHSDGDIILYKRLQEDTTLHVDIISRSWKKSDINLRDWLNDWYKVTFKNRFNSSFEFLDIETDAFINECMA